MNLTPDENKCYIKPCPECGEINISYGTKNSKHADCENLYKCHNCGQKYKEFRFFCNIVGKNTKVNAYKEPIIEVISRKTKRKYKGIDLDSKYYLIEKSENVFVKAPKTLFI